MKDDIEVEKRISFHGRNEEERMADNGFYITDSVTMMTLMVTQITDKG